VTSEIKSHLENFKLNINNQEVELLSLPNLSKKIKYMNIFGEKLAIQERPHDSLKELDFYVAKKHHGGKLESWFHDKDDYRGLFSIVKKYITIPPSSTTSERVFSLAKLSLVIGEIKCLLV